MRRAVWLLSALPWPCLGGAPAAHAAAAPDVGALRQLPREVVTPVVTDGERYAVAGLAGGRRTRLFDTRRGTSRDIGNPSCVNPLAPAPEAAPPLTLVGGGRIVWQCVTYASASQLIWVQDIRTGSRFVAGGVRALWPAEIGTSDGSTFTLIGAGRHWLYAVRRGYHQSADALVGVDTARTILGAADDDPREVIALDRPHGTRPLCRGIRRAAGLGDEVGDLLHEPLVFDRPFAVNLTANPARSYVAVVRR